MYYVYLIESLHDSSWYIGYTPDNPFSRLEKHNSGTEYFTKRKMPWKMIYYESYFNKQDATGREKFLKSGSGRIYLKKQLKNYLSNGLPREGM